MENKKSSLRSVINMLLILALCTCVGFGFTALKFDEINTILIYIAGVVFIAMRTEGRFYSMMASVVAVVSFNFFFAKPYFSLVAEASYFATFAIMLLVSFLISSLTVNIKKKTEEAARSEERAKQEELRANLLRSISHDLRTPLTGISGNANMLIRHGDELSDETKKEIYSAINDDSNWLINLVENLLSITRIDDKVSVNAHDGIVQEVIDDALHHIDAASEKHHITGHYQDEPLWAKMDYKLMTQVIVNLVNNAVKYTAEGSSIDVYADRVGDVIEIKVADNGNGISDDAKRKVFEKFYSDGKINGDSRRGMGLGLYLCKLIMQSHNGSIRVEDNEPHGSVFICTLPATDVETIGELGEL